MWPQCGPSGSKDGRCTSDENRAKACERIAVARHAFGVLVSCSSVVRAAAPESGKLADVRLMDARCVFPLIFSCCLLVFRVSGGVIDRISIKLSDKHRNCEPMGVGCRVGSGGSCLRAACTKNAADPVAVRVSVPLTGR